LDLTTYRLPIFIFLVKLHEPYICYKKVKFYFKNNPFTCESVKTQCFMIVDKHMNIYCEP
jgi:hypothetical protein